MDVCMCQMSLSEIWQELEAIIRDWITVSNWIRGNYKYLGSIGGHHAISWTAPHVDLQRHIGIGERLLQNILIFCSAHGLYVNQVKIASSPVDTTGSYPIWYTSHQLLSSCDTTRMRLHMFYQILLAVLYSPRVHRRNQWIKFSWYIGLVTIFCHCSNTVKPGTKGPIKIITLESFHWLESGGFPNYKNSLC